MDEPTSLLLDLESPSAPPEPRPSRLLARTAGMFLSVSEGGACARYIGSGTHTNDVGACLADVAAPSDVAVYYFEVEVVSPGAKGFVGVGFAPAGFNTSRQPGWEPGSYGYHGDDGKRYAGGSRGEAYGPLFAKAGDVVGCGLVPRGGEVFFTLNGRHLGTAFRGARLPLFPVVGLHSPGEAVKTNFAGPFSFDLSQLAAASASADKAAADGAPLPPHAAHALVRSFLAHHGHAAALAALDAAAPERVAPAQPPPARQAPLEGGGGGGGSGVSPAPPLPPPLASRIAERSAVRAALLDGDPDGAAAAVASSFPELSDEARRATRGALDVARVLEAARRGDAVRAATLARAAAREHGRGGDVGRALAQLCTLIAYEHPAANGAALPPRVAALLHPCQREAVADVVNEALLTACDGAPRWPGGAACSSLERAIRHLAVVRASLRDVRGGVGPRWDARVDLKECPPAAAHGAQQHAAQQPALPMEA